MTRPETPSTRSDDERARLARIRPFLEQRARLKRAVADSFDRAGFLEVETGQLVGEPGQEPTLDPFVVAGRDAPRAWLVTSPELRMKRMLAAGYRRIYELSHCFRSGRGETSPWHEPEFTMLEWYRVGDDASEATILDDVARVLADGAAALGVSAIEREATTIAIDRGFETLTVHQAFARHARVDLDFFLDGDFAAFRRQAYGAGIAARHTDDDAESLFFRILLERVEPKLGRERPTVLRAWPATMAALARLDPKDPRVALRFEVYVAGIELANGFVELTDPVEQRERIVAERARKHADGRDPGPFPERFLRALAHGLPPCCGIALGFDRLLLLLTGAPQIADLTPFPHAVENAPGFAP
jgi:lysyl-tRNA synthetase class 2